MVSSATTSEECTCSCALDMCVAGYWLWKTAIGTYSKTPIHRATAGTVIAGVRDP